MLHPVISVENVVKKPPKIATCAEGAGNSSEINWENRRF